MKSSSTNLPLVTVTAYAMPQPAVVAMPQAIRLPAGPLGPNYRQPVTIRNNSSHPLSLSNAVVNVEGVTVQTTETQPGKLFTLNVTFPTNFQSRTDKPMELTVNTSNPRHSVLHVPFIQAAMPSPSVFPAAPRPTTTNAGLRPIVPATNAPLRQITATVTNAAVR
jgi:hypothetical protein